MDVREKLVELLLQEDDVCKPNECKDCGANGSCYYHRTADTMIAHGVTVQDNTEISDEILKQLRNAPLTVLHEEPTVEVAQEWISVKDKLPEECPHPYYDMIKAVLIYTPVDGYTHIGWYAGKDYRGRDVWKTLSAMRSYQTCTKKVSHWCCLPKPPKGE